MDLISNCKILCCNAEFQATSLSASADSASVLLERVEVLTGAKAAEGEAAKSVPPGMVTIKF